MNAFIVPEKGRNTGTALDRELADEPYDVEWLQELINERGKRAAKTGVGYEQLAEEVESVQRLGDGVGGLRLALKPLGRLKPRPVFDRIELHRKRIESYESPSDAWETNADRFYVGLDQLLDTLVRDGEADLRRLSESCDFEQLGRTAMADRGYQLSTTIGDSVRWAAMADGAIPDSPRLVMVPDELAALGRALAAHRWGDVDTATFGSVARRRETPDADEEALVAATAGDVAGVYMTVTGHTAREQYNLTVDPIPGAVSELAIFERDQRMTEITTLRGFYDRYDDEFAAWRAVIDTVEQTAAEFGFREINTPAVERTELYEVKSGDELLSQTYSFSDKSDRRVTLTPEQTPTRARMVQAKRQALSTPIKWYDTSKRWRYENVQKGRDREFFQTDIDIFGVESVAADAEVIACAATIFKRLELESQVEFLINDRRLVESLLAANGIENTVEVMRVIDSAEKLTEQEFFDALASRGVEGETAQRVERLTSISGPIRDTLAELEAEAPDDEETQAAIDRMRELTNALEAHGVASMCRLDLSIVRGLAYYTGLVFEAFDTAGELRSLFGGGRYDDLVGLFGDREVPAVGFAFGYSPTRELLQREGLWPDERVETDVFVANVSESVRDTALDVARDLRAAGLVVETDLAGRGLGDQFGYADSISSAFVVIVGERDLENDELTVRDMASGEEQQVPLADAVDRLVDRAG